MEVNMGGQNSGITATFVTLHPIREVGVDAPSTYLEGARAPMR